MFKSRRSVLKKKKCKTRISRLDLNLKGKKMENSSHVRTTVVVPPVSFWNRQFWGVNALSPSPMSFRTFYRYCEFRKRFRKSFFSISICSVSNGPGDTVFRHLSKLFFLYINISLTALLLISARDAIQASTCTNAMYESLQPHPFRLRLHLFSCTAKSKYIRANGLHVLLYAPITCKRIRFYKLRRDELVTWNRLLLRRVKPRTA